MAHDAATEILEDVGRRGRLGEDVSCVDFAVELAEFEMTSSASLVHIQVNMLGASLQPTEPSDQAMHVSLSAKTWVGAV